MRIQLIGAAVLILVLTANAWASSWRGIVPLISTRSDVERMLGKPNGLGRYEFDNERAYIYYTDRAPCDRSIDCECLVPNGTVVTIVVTPEIEIKFSKLKVDRTKFEKTKDPTFPGIVSYSNPVTGITYTVERDVVTTISYSPAEKDCRLVLQKARSKPKS